MSVAINGDIMVTDFVVRRLYEPTDERRVTFRGAFLEKADLVASESHLYFSNPQ